MKQPCVQSAENILIPAETWDTNNASESQWLEQRKLTPFSSSNLFWYFCNMMGPNSAIINERGKLKFLQISTPLTRLTRKYKNKSEFNDFRSTVCCWIKVPSLKLKSLKNGERNC